ncbi:Kinesin [Klebsormidium nitens]|uniref:Kinesin n=1 Tax=Klebsormidium nitens TaxID=105231 RepID=A0A1Y1I313_KLENI|nr:Kinesin [Klebsormidium nitens]|eukprot:GAQ85314.1 Kinesin [Klebsormidium nitens]
MSHSNSTNYAVPKGTLRVNVPPPAPIGRSASSGYIGQHWDRGNGGDDPNDARPPHGVHMRRHTVSNLSPGMQSPSEARSPASTHSASPGRSSVGSPSTGRVSARRMYTAAFVEAVQRVREKLSKTKEEWVELKQEASDLQEYSNAKITRVRKYLVVLQDKTRKLDASVRDADARLVPLKKEKRKLFNDLMSLKGNVRVFARVRPQFEDEGLMSCSFPDENTVRVSATNVGGSQIPKRDYEFDRVFGPHVDQTELFEEVQPVVQSVFDGYNACVLAYGQTGAGKTYTMEGTPHNRGLFHRAFEELFHLSNETTAVTSKYIFSVSILEMYNEQIKDLLARRRPSTADYSPSTEKHEIRVENDGSVTVTDVVEEVVPAPGDFANILRSANKARLAGFGRTGDRSSKSHLIVMVHVAYQDIFTGEKHTSKLVMVDMAGSERLSKSEASGDRLTESLHINRSLSAVGDVVSALTAQKRQIPYANSKLTHLMADCLGGEAKALLLVNVGPGAADVQETTNSLSFAARARNVELTLGNKENTKKWRDMASEAKRELYQKETQIEELQRELLELRRSDGGAESQAELQQAQEDLRARDEELEQMRAELDRLSQQKEYLESDHARLFEQKREQEAAHERIAEQKRQLEEDHRRAEERQRELERAHTQMAAQARELETAYEHIAAQKREVEEDHRNELAAMSEGHAARLAQEKAVRERKVVLLQQQVTQLEAQLAEATTCLAMASLHGPPKKTVEPPPPDDLVKSKLDEELAKRDELIERLHQENERLFERLTAAEAESQAKQEDGDWLSEAKDEVPKTGRPSYRPSSIELRRIIEGSDTKFEEVGNGVGSGSGNDRQAAVASSSGRPLTPSASAKSLPAPKSTIKTTPAGEYLCVQLDSFDVDAFGTEGERADGVNKLLMLVLAAVIKAGSAREHEMLAELRASTFAFLERVASLPGVDTVLVARVRILYIRSLIQQSPELKDAAAAPLERFLAVPDFSAADAGTPDTPTGALVPTEGFRIDVHVRPVLKKKKSFGFNREKKVEAEGGHLAEGKAEQVKQDARIYATGNKAMAALFAHTLAGELTSRLRSWIADHFEFLNITGFNGQPSETDVLTAAIMEGWMAGLGVTVLGSSDALGQLLSDYALKVYEAQLEHLEDLAGTLASEEAEDLPAIARLRAGLETIEHRRQRIRHQIAGDPSLLPPAHATLALRRLDEVSAEQTRIDSLALLEELLIGLEAVVTEALQSPGANHRALSAKLETLVLQSGALAPADRAVVDECIEAAREELPDAAPDPPPEVSSSEGSTANNADVTPAGGEDPQPTRGGDGMQAIQWSVVQFSNGVTEPVVVKCGANDKLDLAVQSGNGKVAVLPVPGVLGGMDMDQIKHTLGHVPPDLVQLAMARTPDGTRARYTRLYKTLAARVPKLRAAMGAELEDFAPNKGAGKTGS